MSTYHLDDIIPQYRFYKGVPDELEEAGKAG